MEHRAEQEMTTHFPVPLILVSKRNDKIAHGRDDEMNSLLVDAFQVLKCHGSSSVTYRGYIQILGLSRWD